MLTRNDLVKLANKPEYGDGRIIEIEGTKYRVFFEQTGQTIILESSVAVLEKVERCPSFILPEQYHLRLQELDDKDICSDGYRFAYSNTDEKTFANGTLRDQWYEQYKGILFDDADLSNAKGQPGNYFIEWLAAIRIYELTDHKYRTLVELYECKDTHIKKQPILQKFLGHPFYDYITCYKKPEYGNAQCPDLFVYSEEINHWFFCETKRVGEAFTPSQKKFFPNLKKIAPVLNGHSIEIRLIRFAQE